jgi:hypothetical protein
MTDYCSIEVEVGPGLSLYLDGNSKITGTNGSYAAPVPNALSLPHIATCPGSTPTCRASCYVFGLQRNAPEVYSKYAQNERVIHQILLSSAKLVSSARLLAGWITEHAAGGFRWHVSGDVFSTRYAEWIAQVARHSPEVRHWIYTRSLDRGLLWALLRQANNLVVNLSTDQDTYPEAIHLATTEGLRVCYLTQDGTLPQDLPEGSIIFPDYKLRGRNLDKPTEHAWWQGLSPEYRKMVCPADFFGQSEQHRCGVCRKCMDP